jgi:hypothetical protein
MFISRVHVEVADNTFDEFKIRTRIYELDTATGLPGRDLLNESVVTSSTLENGRLDIDLSKYNIEIYGDFYLGFEWILDKDDRKNLFLQYEGFRKDHPDKVVTNYVKIDGERIPYLNYQGNLYAGPSFGISVSQGSLKNNMCFYRLNSFGRWYRCPSILAAGIVLSDQPYPIAGKDLTSENVSDERIEAILPYYKIERRPFEAKNEEFIWHLHPDDTGYFAQKMREAIIIEVRRQVNKLSFYAKNNSFYPYQLEMNFSKMVNLRPIVSRKTYTVYPGINKLLEFNVVDPSIENFHYELSTKEIIGDPDNIPIRTYPYLFPLGKSHEVHLNVEPSDNYIAFDEFKLNSNDTVYAMRKGIVGATPVMGKNVDRISARETLEIIHSDGTIMIYDNLNPQKIFVTAGEVVYPGQPLGIIGSSNIIRVELFKISRLGRLERLDISYYTGEDDNHLKDTLPDGYMVSYPDAIIVKEMTEQEVNKYRGRTLY